MPDGMSNVEIPKPLIALGAGATLAFVLSACGTPPEAIATFAQLKVDTLQPHTETVVAPVEESGLPTAIAKEGDNYWSVTARAFDVSVAQLEDNQQFPDFGLFINGDNSLWFANKSALVYAGGMTGLLPDLAVGAPITAGKRAEVSDYILTEGFITNQDLIKLTGDRVVLGDDAVRDQLTLSGGDFGSESVFVYDHHSDITQDRGWEAQLSEGRFVPSADILGLMKSQGITFSEAAKQLLASLQANN